MDCSCRTYRVGLKQRIKETDIVKHDNLQPPKRRYPAFWEKAVPIALTVIVLAIVLLLVVVFAVATGLLPGAR
jgi:hypothetical protein